jgi:Zn-dependent protease with chaperone function
MIRESKIVVKIALGVMLAVLSTLEKGIDYTFVEYPYQKYVKEFVKELEDAGIKIPEQKRWTVRTEPSFFVTTTIGQAIGMFDDRQVMVFVHPLLKLQKPNVIRFVIWHELSHDIFNLRHGSTMLMKTTASNNDGAIFPIAKKILIEYLKENL